MHILAHALAEVYKIRAKEMRLRRVRVLKEERGAELKHSTFEERRDVVFKDALMSNIEIERGIN